MIEQMNNKNEYRENGNLYVNKIKSCLCSVKEDDKYTITCNIYQRGTHDYSFNKTDKWITKSHSERRLLLSDVAEATVCRTVELFEERLNRIMSEGCREIKMEDAEISVFYEDFAGKFDCVLKYFNDCTKQTVTELHTGTSIEKLLHYLQFMKYICDSESKELLQNPTKENIMKNPFIIAAKKDGDVKTEKKIKMFYRLADKNDRNTIAKILGLRILPTLPDEYNKEYYIDSDTVTNKSYALLSRSGFKILHRPYFAMNLSTHTKITLNPHTKIGVDAAKKDTASMSFGDFLEMYDKYEIDNE